jgi:hypothetical protein
VQLFSLRYYLRDLLWEVGDVWQKDAPGRTNYHTLLTRLELWREEQGSRIAYVSFNYDRMLDKAVRDVLGSRLETVDRYAGDGFDFFKPHGSVNWIQIVNRFVLEAGVAGLGVRVRCKS